MIDNVTIQFEAYKSATKLEPPVEITYKIKLKSEL